MSAARTLDAPWTHTCRTPATKESIELVSIQKQRLVVGRERGREIKRERQREETRDRERKRKIENERDKYRDTEIERES